MISKGVKSIFPIKNQEIWDRYKLHIQAFWTPEEVSLHDDIRDLQTLNDGEKRFIKHVLAFFANSEAMINENLASRFYKEILIPEARCFISMQMLNESIHAEMYGLQIEAYVKDSNEKDMLFDAIQNVDSDTSGLWFFNSSKEAGASQPHRHFQLLPRQHHEKICPRYDWFCSILNSSNQYKSDISHSIAIRARKKSKLLYSNDLFNSYLSMVDEMKIANFGSINQPLKPYNLLITAEWISLISRKTDKSKGFNINALGFAGYFLGTKISDVDTLIKFGPEKILKNVI